MWTEPESGAVFAHRRLAIIDLSPGGSQPMTSAEGRYVIMFNGEIYNYRDIGRELQAAGRTLRRLRITIWLVILALVGALAYLNQVGLPNVVKRPLLEKLRARGIDLQFSRLRLRWYHGIVADNVAEKIHRKRE